MSELYRSSRALLSAHITHAYTAGPMPTWVVVLADGSCFEMNAHADQPNGLCSYLGNWADNSGLRWDGQHETDATALPIGIKRQVAVIVTQADYGVAAWPELAEYDDAAAAAAHHTLTGE